MFIDDNDISHISDNRHHWKYNMKFEVTTVVVCTKAEAWTFEISITTYQIAWCNTAKAQNTEMENLHFRKFL